MFSEQMIKDFLNFKVLISEKFLKYIFWAISALAIVGAAIWILTSWWNAFNVFRYSFLIALWLFLGQPVLILLGLILYLILLRMGFELILLLFLIYRELKKVSSRQ